MTEVNAIEITSPEIAELITEIVPTFKELDYEKDLKGSFFMVGFPEAGQFAVVPPQGIAEHWDHIENGRRITIKKIVR